MGLAQGGGGLVDESGQPGQLGLGSEQCDPELCLATGLLTRLAR
jgi:hypothetical protein